MVFLRLLQARINQTKPKILVTYGGYWLGGHLLELGHIHGMKNVLLLQNLAYDDPAYFHDVDLILVPSQFASNHYTEKLSIPSTPIPPMMDWGAFRCDPNGLSRKYVTFVNPEPGKGVYVFAQIAKQLWERRPDIPLLVVEGRAGIDWLVRTDVNLRAVKNMNLMINTPDPCDFYRVTKIMLVPSLFTESFGRVAAEAMINGIPVIGSNRGALPEVIGNSGLTLEIPAQYTPDTRIAPTPDEVEPWVQAVIKLWDDVEFYCELSIKGKAHAECWRPEIIADQYDKCFSKLIDEYQAHPCALLPGQLKH